MAFLFVSVLVVLVGRSHAMNPLLPFYENFEPEQIGHWDFRAEWRALDVPFDSQCNAPPAYYCPVDPGLPPASAGWGPVKFETWPDKDTGGMVWSGQRSGRQPIFDPYWVSLYHEFIPPPPPRELRAKVWLWDPADILCDCDQQAQPPFYTCNCATIGTNPPPRPSRPNFDVHGWLILTNPTRSDWLALGINSKQSWDHYVWGTKSNGWVVSTLPRTEGWKRLEIVVPPYSGTPGEVRFMIDGQVIGLGSRMPGSGQGEAFTWLRIGSDPALITESHLTNTFEQFWYDEVALTACHDPRPDADGDGDVDQDDFGVFQRCFTGPGNPFLLRNPAFDAPACQCMDADGDQDVDTTDFATFQNCVSGPAISAAGNCDS